MNPSANGWVKKYFSQHDKFQLFQDSSYPSIIEKIRKIGFSYGILNFQEFPIAFHGFKYTNVELSKICYLQLLEQVYNNAQNKHKDFTSTLVEFYEILIPHKNNIFTALFAPKNPIDKLEEIFTVRWKEHFFSQSVENTQVLNMILLCMDVIAFEKYLQDKTNPNAYSQTLAKILEQIVLTIKDQKDPKQPQDNKLISFLQKSISINNDEHQRLYASALEMAFIEDFTLCNAWDNTLKQIVYPDLDQPVFTLLQIKRKDLELSAKTFEELIELQNKEYQFYKSSNLFGNVLTNSTCYIEHLLSRNKTRIVKEIKKDAKLMQLLAEATHRSLDDQEKKLVKTQTIEIIKTIPSLAIFLLPGGTVLLPIILRFIPTLLPSAFNENMQKDN